MEDANKEGGGTFAAFMETLTSLDKHSMINSDIHLKK